VNSSSITPITNYPNAPDIESSSWSYAERFNGAIGKWLLSHQESATRTAIESEVINAVGLRVLDVGGGHGQNIDLIHGMGHSITVYGSDQSCAEVIAEKISSGLVSFDSGPLLELPYGDNSFDVVLCYRILSHMESWEELVSELVRVADKLVLIDYPSVRSVNFASGVLYGVKKGIEKNTRPFKCFRDREIDQLFSRNGCARVFRHRQFFLPMALYRLINNVAVSRMLYSVFRTLGLIRGFGSPVIAGYARKAE